MSSGVVNDNVDVTTSDNGDTSFCCDDDIGDDGDEATTFCFDDESDNGDNNEAATNCCDNEFGDDANSFSIDDDNNAEDDVTPATPTFCNDGVDDNDEDVSDKSDDEVFKGKTICCEDKVCSNGGDDRVSDDSDDDDCGDLSTLEDTFGCEDKVGGDCCKDDDDECATAFPEDDVIDDCGDSDHNDSAATWFDDEVGCNGSYDDNDKCSMAFFEDDDSKDCGDGNHNDDDCKSRSGTEEKSTWSCMLAIEEGTTCVVFMYLARCLGFSPLWAWEGAPSSNTFSSTLTCEGSSTSMERATGFLLFLSVVTDEINWYGEDFDDHDVSADVTYEGVIVRFGQSRLGGSSDTCSTVP